ncbi:DUF397 domain-containing protein [Actinomadura geliboluensis]|uniref:DUF397 domain-containing protein n=1 Tax=Actinomadura geliboluensis TaxID=882440 RepID=UPI0036BBDF82
MTSLDRVASGGTVTLPRRSWISSSMWQDAAWRKSSHSQGGGTECVEIAQVGNSRAVRDSRNPTGPVLAYSSGEWAAFLQAVKAGAHDLPWRGGVGGRSAVAVGLARVAGKR